MDKTTANYYFEFIGSGDHDQTYFLIVPDQPGMKAAEKVARDELPAPWGYDRDLFLIRALSTKQSARIIPRIKDGSWTGWFDCEDPVESLT